MPIVLKYKEWLATSPEDTFWVYDLCFEMPEWSDIKQEYLFRKKPKRIDAQRAREIIRDEGLVCVCNNDEGKIYA